MQKSTLTLILFSSSMFYSSWALAQTVVDPKFEYGKAEAIKPAAEEVAEWKAAAKAGLVTTSGNSQATSFTVGANASRKKDWNKYSLEGGAAYARANILSATDTNASGFIDAGEIYRQSQVTTNSWFSKLRYDRFFTEFNSLYIAANGAGDRPAGKDFFGGGQAGYSRQLYKSWRHDLVAELGYDFAYEHYLDSHSGVSSVNVHAARIFVGETLKLIETASLYANAEAFFNLNKENAPNASDLTKKEVDPLKDTRFVGKAGLSAQVWKNISLSVGFTLKYDQNPAPLAKIGTAPAFAAGFVPFAEKTDTLTEAALVINFL